MFWSILAVSTHVFLFMLVFFVSSDCYQILMKIVAPIATLVILTE